MKDAVTSTVSEHIKTYEVKAIVNKQIPPADNEFNGGIMLFRYN